MTESMTALLTCPPSRLARLLPGGVLALALFSVLASTSAQTPPATAASPAQMPVKPPAAPKPVVGPLWAELTPAQHDILSPLASNWNTLSLGHKRKWLEVTKSYPSLSAEEQAKMQGRMKDWVALSPQQRAQARLNFAKTKELSKELTPEQKQAKWQAYQSLSAEEKSKLAAKAPPKPGGAAHAAKPVAAQMLVSVPSRAEKAKAKTAPKIAVSQPTDGQPEVHAVPTPATVPSLTPVHAQ